MPVAASACRSPHQCTASHRISAQSPHQCVRRRISAPIAASVCQSLHHYATHRIGILVAASVRQIMCISSCIGMPVAAPVCQSPHLCGRCISVPVAASACKCASCCDDTPDGASVLQSPHQCFGRRINLLLVAASICQLPHQFADCHMNAPVAVTVCNLAASMCQSPYQYASRCITCASHHVYQSSTINHS